jgi:hypothetical protein
MILELCTLVAVANASNKHIQTEYTRIISRNGGTILVYRCPQVIDKSKYEVSYKRPLRELNNKAHSAESETK